MNSSAATRQRTALAWGRTALAAGGFGVAMLRLGAQHHSTLDLLAALGFLACSLLLALRSRALYHRAAAKPIASSLRLVAAVALSTGALVAVAGAG